MSIPGALAGCAFLHNATSGSIAGLRHPDLADLASYPAFAADEVAALRSFLTRGWRRSRARRSLTISCSR